MKVFSPRAHGMFDYPGSIWFLLAPTLLRFQGVASVLCTTVGVMMLLLSILSNYSMGLIKVIPFRAHLAIDLIAGVFLVLSPWLFGFAADGTPRNFMVIMGSVIFVATLMTRASEHGRREPRPA